MTKHCNKCNTTKSREDFTKRKQSKDGLYPICKTCKRKTERNWRTPEKNKQYNLKRCFDMSQDDYKKMLDKQEGVCAICSQAETTARFGKIQSLSVHQCPTTGAVRGLLCSSCSRALGNFNNSVSVLQRALSYLERFNG